MPSLDLGTLEKLDGLDDATRRRVNYLVARYRSTVRAAPQPRPFPPGGGP